MLLYISVFLLTI